MTAKPPTSVFDEYFKKAWPYRYAGQLYVGVIAGGVPSNPNVAEGWIRSKLQTTDDAIRQMVAETMVARGIDVEEEVLDRDAVIEQVAALKTLNGFKRDDKGLYVEGRQLKAALKEAVSVAVAAGKLRQKQWGTTNKWITKYFPEHVFIEEERLYLGVTEPSGINQRFVTTQQGKRAIQYEEYVVGATIDFHVATDHEFSDEEWAMIWLTGELQGIGAARSAGFGTYKVTSWKKVRQARKAT